MDPTWLILARVRVASGGLVSGNDEKQGGAAVQQLKLVITADAGCHSRAMLVRQLPLMHHPCVFSGTWVRGKMKCHPMQV